MKNLKVTIEFITEVLGSSPADKNLHSEYIASKAPDAKSKEEEIAAMGVTEAINKDMTIFPKFEDGKPYFWDYQVRGFFKGACGFLQRCKGEEISKESCKLKAYKKIIDGCIFVEPRKIPIEMAGEMTNCERPLRAQTAQGERVALANSEEIPAGSRITFNVLCLSDAYAAAVKEWLSYGYFHGMGQWRNGGKGRFKVVSVEEVKTTDLQSAD